LKSATKPSVTHNHSKPALGSVAACPLCKSERKTWELVARPFGSGAFERELFSIYRCPECGLGITDPVPSETDSRMLYEERTSNDFQVDDSWLAAVLKRAAATRDVQALVGGLCEPGSRMLDYACGNGAFALSIRKAFPDNAVWATDYHLEAPPMLKGTDIHYASYQELPAHAPFDFILCRHVLEHTYDPTTFLIGIRALLSTGGVLVIEVPNLHAPLSALFGKHWDGHYAPYHPIHFSAAALLQAATRAGFASVRAGGCEMPKIGRSLRKMIGCPYNSALFLSGVFLHPLQIAAAALAGEPTCLRLWARKV
jgi:SAM-dependent methyltransferase